VTVRPTARRFSRLTAAGALTLAAACATDQSLTAPEGEASFMSTADAVAAVQSGPPEYVPGELLVQFRDGVTTTGRGRALGRVGGQVAEEILTGAMRSRGRRVGVTRIKVNGDVSRAMAALQSDADVEFAEPNWIYKHSATSNDTYFTNGSLWGMSAGGNQFGSGAATAWAANNTGSSSVYIGIIDEGYMFNHPDLAANAGVNPGEIAGDGVDNDGNGLVDDVRGWDFAGNNSSVFDGVGDDHGTHVAGTIGGVGGNGVGVAGVVWSVKLLNAKFLGSTGGTTANAIKAVDYFTNLKIKGVNIVATNNSWGGGGYSQALFDAIERANDAGVLFIAAAGNSTLNCETSSCYPAEYANDNVIAVASITSTGAISSFSNYGSSTIDIGAPGSAIWSTVPVQSRRNAPITGGYASYSGTSMATPHVSGAAALYASTHVGATAAQIKAAIIGSVTATQSLAGKTVTGGRLNVAGF
jgi:subtilisin family serine protease